MGCFSSKPSLVGVPDVHFDEQHVNDEQADKFIANYQHTLREVMMSATGDARLDAKWQEQPCPTVPGMRLFYGYASGVQGPLVVTDYTLAGVDPDALFKWLCSVEGFKVIDPDTKNHERPPVQTLTWHDRAEITHAIAPNTIPFVYTRTFMVLNAFDKAERLFISVPVLHDDFPKSEEVARKQIRALNVWASWVLPCPGGAKMVSFCWIAMNGSFPASLTDTFMREKFMQEFHKRLVKAVAAHPDMKIKSPNTDVNAEKLGSNEASPEHVVVA